MPPRVLVLALGALLVALVATSPPRRVGDGREYLAMAMNLARLRPPALSGPDAARVEERLEAVNFGGPPLIVHPELRDGFGRQDFPHFWFYPALAVPGVWLTTLVGAHPNHAFVAVNALLFLSAVWVLSRRLAWYFTAALCCSPVIWWIDKSHTEVFTFSLLAVAFALVREAPWWAMISVAAAATQNPPIAALVPAVAAVALVREPGRWRDRRVWAGGLTAGTIALLHPLYYWWRHNLATPLLSGTDPRIPAIKDLGAVLWDPNLGLIAHAPLLALLVALAVVVVAVRKPVRLLEADVWLAVAGAGVFLLSFAQTTNVSSGATAGMSRYAVWLIPLAIPILDRAGRLAPARWQRWIVPVALASCAWSLVASYPRRPESHLHPTRLAGFLWTRWPSADNPLPEIFTERLSGREPGLAPIATPGCTKVLTVGGEWPVPCWPRQPAPAACQAPQALCYANRENGGYRFVRAERPRLYRLARQTWSWNPSSDQGVERILGRLRWQDLRRVPSGGSGGMVRAAYDVSWTDELQSEQDLLVFVDEAQDGARLHLRLPGRMAGSLVDVATGDEIEAVRIETQPWELLTLPLPAGRGMVLVISRSG